MPYTRRDLIRDAALVSATGVAAGLPFVITGCRKPTHGEVQLTTAPKAFNAGVRIFFSGSWLFGSSPQPGMMQAVSRDMPTLKHNFPWGVWTQNGIDGNASLISNPHPNAYAVTVNWSNQKNPAPSVSALFVDAAPRSFSYITSTDSATALTIDTTDSHCIVVTIPIPTRITPAAFQSGASIVNVDAVHPSPTPANDGIATTHIFDYEFAKDITFTGTGVVTKKVTASDGSGKNDSAANLHFHTIPKNDPGFNHGPLMFDNLLRLLKVADNSCFDRSQLALIIPDSCTLAKGAYVPQSINTDELEMTLSSTPQYSPLLMKLASCAGGSVGIDPND